jgi:hypothetical protein
MDRNRVRDKLSGRPRKWQERRFREYRSRQPHERDGRIDLSDIPEIKDLPSDACGQANIAPARKAFWTRNPFGVALGIVSGDMQRRSIFGVAMWFNDDFNILIERYEETHEALHGKLPKLSAQHLGDIGLFDA